MPQTLNLNPSRFERASTSRAVRKTSRTGMHSVRPQNREYAATRGKERERERKFTPFQPHRADAGAANQALTKCLVFGLTRLVLEWG